MYVQVLCCLSLFNTYYTSLKSVYLLQNRLVSFKCYLILTNQKNINRQIMQSD